MMEFNDDKEVFNELEREISTRKRASDDARVHTQAVSYTHLRAHETVLDLVCRLLLEKKQLDNPVEHLNASTHTRCPTVRKPTIYNNDNTTKH